MNTSNEKTIPKNRWWHSFGPALITACVVLGPGSLLVSSNIGAQYGYDLLWIFALTGIFMGAYVTMAARIGVAGGSSACSLVHRLWGRPLAAVIGVTVFLVASTFQFGNNLALATAIQALFPVSGFWLLLVMNGCVILFIFTTTRLYFAVEQVMKVMAGLIVIFFLANLFVSQPDLQGILAGLLPTWPADLPVRLPQEMDGQIIDPLLPVASLIGTTFVVACAFYQSNLVRDKGWTMDDYRDGIRDAIGGVSLLAVISAVIAITTATVIPGQQSDNVGTLAQSLEPLLGPAAHVMFCLGLLAVTLTSFLVNAMIGGGMLAEGLGKPARLADPWPRRFTVLVLLAGFLSAVLILKAGVKPVSLIIFGQALTVLGNPLMAAVLLWLANRKDIMGDKKNGWVMNIIGGLGFLTVVVLAFRVFYRLVIQIL